MANRKILILGGGFGGIKTALELANNPNFDITLISDQHSFRYYPTLYHSAVGGSPMASQIPLSEIFGSKKVSIIKDSAKELDRDSKTVYGTSGKAYHYDTLVIALGVVTNFFGIKGLKNYAYGIKTLKEASRLHDHLHKQALQADQSEINYIVIGGGPTGVELAGVLPSYINHIVNCHGKKPKKIHIDLVEAAPRLLPRMSKSYSKTVAKHLNKLGIKLYLGEAVVAATANGLMLKDHGIKSHTLIWTAGVATHPFLEENNFLLGQAGRVAVNKLLQSEENIYVIGDNADTPYCGMAQTALRDGAFVAKNIKRIHRGKKPRAYIPKNPIYVTPAGPNWAAVKWGNLYFYGRLGWWLRGAADFVAYHKIEPWWPATGHWLESIRNDESCKVCKPK